MKVSRAGGLGFGRFLGDGSVGCRCSQGRRSPQIASVWLAGSVDSAGSGRAESRCRFGGVVCGRVSVGVTLRRGRGRPPSEAQVLGLMPAAQLAPQRAFSVASRWRRPRPSPSRAGLACQSATCWRYACSACSGELELAPADVFERVCGGGAFAALAGRQPGAQLERAAFLVGQRRALRTRSPRRVRSSSSTGRRACGRSRRSRSACRDGRGRAQRTRAAARGPGGGERRLDQHPAGVSAALLGDPAVTGGLAAGLPTRGFSPR